MPRNMWDLNYLIRDRTPPTELEGNERSIIFFFTSYKNNTANHLKPN